MKMTSHVHCAWVVFTVKYYWDVVEWEFCITNMQQQNLLQLPDMSIWTEFIECFQHTAKNLKTHLRSKQVFGDTTMVDSRLQTYWPDFISHFLSEKHLWLNKKIQLKPSLGKDNFGQYDGTAFTTKP